MATIVNTRNTLLSGTRTADNYKSIGLTADKLAFIFDGAGTASPAAQVITFIAAPVRTTNPITWSTIPSGIPLYNAATGGAAATTESTVYLRVADFGSNSAIQVIATIIDGTVITSSLNVVKQQPGATGASGKTVSLTTSTQAFSYNSAGTTPSPSTTILTATAQNTSGTVFYEFLIGVTSVQNTTTNTYTYTPQAAYSNMPQQLTVRIREGTNSSSILATDTLAIVGVKPGVDGANAISGFLSNESVTVAADSAGNVASYTGTGGTFYVYDGVTDKTGNASVTYSVVPASAVGITASIAATGVYTISNMLIGSDSGTVIFRAVYGSVTINKVYNISKSKTGIVGDTAVFAYRVISGASLPAAPSITQNTVPTTGAAVTGTTWYLQPKITLAADEWMFQVSGTRTAAGVYTWQTQGYLSTFKVGKLEALTTDTGNLTVSSTGSIKTTGSAYGQAGGFFMGNDLGTTKFSISDRLLFNGSTLTVPAITISDNGILSGGGGGQVTIRGVGYTGDLNAAAGTRLVVSGTGLTLNGNSCDRTSSTGTWDAQCYSVDAYTGGAFCSFTAKNTISYFMAGLDTNPTANASYTNLDYAFYILPDGTLRIYESNIDIGSFGTYTGTDVLSVIYDGQFVRYAQNGTILRTVPADAGLKLYFDSSIINEGFRNIQFGPYSNTNTARGTNLIDPSWWKTGTNPAAYWNTTNDLTTPATDITSTYTWATGAFTQPVVANGWYIQPGSVGATGLTLWAVNTVIVDSGGPVSSTATWPRFQAPYIVGTATTTGSRTAVLDLYIWSSTVPTVFPSGTSTYTWFTAQFTAPATLNGWSIVPGTATAGQTLYVLTQIHINSTATTTSSVTWNATNPVAIKTADLTITRTGILKLYKWHNSAVNAPTSLFQGTDSFIPGTLPDNSTDTVWHSVSGNTNNTNPGGGWNPTTAATNSFPVNSSKTYMFAVYAKSVSSPVNSAGGVGYAFWGIDADAVCDLNTTTANTNPYFAYTNKVTGEWHLLVGYVYPAGTTGQNSATAGAYRCSDGVKITASTISANFTWKATTTVASTRCFQYYQAPGAEQQFAWPQVYLCDGTEPSIDDLLSMSVKNNIAAQNTTTFTGTNVTVNGKVFTKTTGTNQAWDAEVYSNDSYIGGAYASVRVANITYLMFGLNSDPKTDSSYASLDYALYLTGDGNIYDYRNGTQFLLIGTYIVGDILAVTYDGVVVRYIKNGTVIGNPITVNITAPLFFDSSFRDIGGSLSNVQFGPLTSIGAVTATAASKLSKSSADILTGPINLNAEKAITVGNPALDPNPVTQTGKTGVYIGNTGIVATKNGVATITISNTGDANFAGTLAANTVTANSILVTGRGAALNDDPACQDQSAWTGWGGNPVATVTAISDGKVGNWVLRASTSSRSISAKLIPADPGKTYRLSAWVRRVNSNGVFYLRTVDYGPTETSTAGGLERAYTGLEAITPPNAVWTRYSTQFTVPTGRAFVSPHIILAWGGTTGYMEAQDIRIEEAASADLIVDGAVTANKISSDFILANRQVIVGSSPAISGTTMTGSGAVINSTGTFALGGTTSNIVGTGSAVYVNGEVIATSNLVQGAVNTVVNAKTASTVTITHPDSPDFLNNTTHFGTALTTASIVVPSGNAVLIAFTWDYTQTGGSGAQVFVRIRRSGGTEVYKTRRATTGTGTIGSQIPVGAVYVDSPPAGTYTYYLEFELKPYISQVLVNYAEISLLLFKKPL